jgi:hypothetical protein
MESKIYVLVTGKIYQKIKDIKRLEGYKSIEVTNTYAIGGPLDPNIDSCIFKRFNGHDGWQCFNSLEEARTAALNYK